MGTIPRTVEEYREFWAANTDVPYGLCWCGCQATTTLAPCSNITRLWFRGEPVRWRPGHHGLGGTRITPPSTRFWYRVRKTDGCWLWTGAKDAQGYGVIWHCNRRIKAHRVSYEMHHGSIPVGMAVCHSCDTPGCVAPHHLFLGTQTDNMHDAISKGRMVWQTHPERMARGDANGARKYPERRPRGERVGTSRLSEVEVREILKRLESGDNQYMIARDYGIKQPTVSSINCGKAWKHIPRN